MKTHLVLQKYIHRRRESPGGYSAKQLAAALEISPSFLSRMLSGKKPIPYGLLIKFAQELGIEPEVFSNLQEAHSVPLPPGKAPRRGAAEVNMPLGDWELAPEQAQRVLREWFYIPILELTFLSSFDGSAQAVAQRLGLPIAVAEKALQELQSLGLIEIQNGRWKKRHWKLRFSSGTSSGDIRRFHSLLLEKAKEELKKAVSSHDFERRLITGITITATPEKIEQAKKKLADCLHEIANDLVQNPGTEVYHLSAQLFPLTK